MNNNQYSLSYITLGVTNFNEMFSFYQSLEFPLVKSSQHPGHLYAMFKVGSIILALYPVELLEKQSGSTMGDSNSRLSLSLNVSNKNQVDTLLKLAQTKGAVITQLPFKPEWGGYCGYFKDPESNLWEIVWHENYQFTPALQTTSPDNAK